MTSTRLTQQNRSREWAAAPSAATHIPHSPASGNSWHGSDAGSNTTPQTPGRPRTRPTHAHGWAGGCCVVGAPTRSTLGPPRRGPEPARRGGYAAPSGALLPALPNASDCRADERGSSRTRRNLPPDSPNLTQAGRHASAALFHRPPFAPPGGLTPLPTRAVPAAPSSVTRDTRREGTRAPLRNSKHRSSHCRFTAPKAFLVWLACFYKL